MAKYDLSLTELKNLLSTSKSILIALPANANIDQLASALSLFLTLRAAGKQVSVVCDDNIIVGQSYLFGINHIQKNISITEGGNLTLTLEGVAASNNTVPALEKLDWSAENNNLNLVFHVLPGQTFQPSRIIPKYQGSGFNLIFTIGALNLNALGNIYSQNPQVFSGIHLVNIDSQMGNASFGQTNVLDANTSSNCEIMVNLIADLGLNLDGDSASNLLAGIFDATANLTNEKAGAETFMAVAQCLRVGGKKPGLFVSASESTQVQPAFDWSALMPKEQPIVQSQSQPEFIVPPVVQSQQTIQSSPENEPMPSPEERPMGEGVISETPEPDWLTPKIFKGSSLG